MDIDNLFTYIELPDSPEPSLHTLDIDSYPRTKKILNTINKKSIDKSNWLTEQWKDVNGYCGIYQVSSHGRVRSVTRTHKNRNGVMQTFSTKYLKPIKVATTYAVQFVDCIRYVHKLVAEAFVNNKTKYNDVIWIDGNKNNNYYGNLKWGCIRGLTTHASKVKSGEKMQSNYGYSSILSKKSKPIIQYTLNGEFVAEWANGVELMRCLNINRGSVIRVCSGKEIKTQGFLWKYKQSLLSELGEKDDDNTE